MGKKVLIAAVAVVAALVVINFTRLGSHLRLLKTQCCSALQKQIPPEQEINRLEMELDNLAKEDERHFHKVATQIVEVKNLQEQYARFAAELKGRETRIVEIKESLKGEAAFVTYKGEKFSRNSLTSELRMAAQRFQVDEALLQSKEEQLTLRKQNLETNREKLSQLKLVRQQMKTELEKLKTALGQERQRQAAEQNTLDDASYQKLRKEMDHIRNNIEVLKEKRVLRGEVDSPIKAVEEKKEKEAATDRYIETRFGNNKQ